MGAPSVIEVNTAEKLKARHEKHKEFFSSLTAVLSNASKQLIVDAQQLEKYRKDSSVYQSPLPLAAVLPGSTEEVAAVVRVCAKYRIPVTPRGAGTGLEGGALPYAGGIVIDTNDLNSISFDQQNACVWVGAGVRKLKLNEEAEKLDFLFGPDPASDPCVGGMVSTSGSGMCTLRYGTTRENVLSLRVVTPEGKIMQTRQVVRKSSSGLDITQLYIGSEGTLGIICEICFKLYPKTRYSAGAYACFRNLSDAVRAVVAIKLGNVPRTLLRCELVNTTIVEATNPHCRKQLPIYDIMLLEFTSNDPSMSDIKKDYEKIFEIANCYGNALEVHYLKAGKETEDIWQMRRRCYYAATHWNNKVHKLLSTDICVPLTNLTEIVTFSEKIFKDANKPFFLCAHISDGNYHVTLPYQTDEELAEMHRLERIMIVRAIELGGTVSGEHGIGVGKIPLVTLEHGQVHIDVQESIKAALDKNNIMNPGIFYPGQQKKQSDSHL